ncbi:DUF167 domain-containing protein [Niveispirillum sp. BGYR6]|uniref:DUF167 domain-containing protein n=1 Tax=Niveispirillum sp. BGYR6 TaxID=2971249 RepID=UPI0022B9468F|nr:DUF167 domain-containing protein [Niveispirillum sp. BGYR6]MDG5495369.1 DUF167 domain-containing protein [Niveispirillum sp. BGYR6]
MARPALEPAAGGVRLFVRAAPRASRNAVQGQALGADDRMQVKVSVTAVPEDGKANAAIIQLLAKAWRIPKSSIDVVAGGTDRSKVLFVAGDTAQLQAQLTAWLAAL